MRHFSNHVFLITNPPYTQVIPFTAISTHTFRYPSSKIWFLSSKLPKHYVSATQNTFSSSLLSLPAANALKITHNPLQPWTHFLAHTNTVLQLIPQFLCSYPLTNCGLKTIKIYIPLTPLPMNFDLLRAKTSRLLSSNLALISPFFHHGYNQAHSDAYAWGFEEKSSLGSFLCSCF